jgi:uncharacterized protein YjgD (DUF1641 family)
MLQAEQVEELISMVSGLDRSAIIDQFRNFQASFPIDFSRDFLEREPIDRLRHLLLALCLQQQRMPLMLTPEAA